MSKCILKTKFINILNLADSSEDFGLTEDETIINVKYELSTENTSIYHISLLCSKGTILYIQYNIDQKKILKFNKNIVLCSLINLIELSDFSFYAPILVSTSSNEILYIDTREKNKDICNLNEESIIVLPAFVENQILDIKFNDNKNIILVTSSNCLQVYKLIFDKDKQKNCLNCVVSVPLSQNIINQNFFDNNLKVLTKFSDFNENVFFMMSLTNKEEIKSNTLLLDQDDKTEDGIIYFNISKITINKKDTSTLIMKSFEINKNLIRAVTSYFSEKLIFLFENRIICCVNPFNTKDDLVDKFSFRNHQNTNIKFEDIFIHSSSSYFLVQDSEFTFFIFDFTLNLYYIINNNKIINRINYPLFTKQSQIKQSVFKPYEVHNYLRTVVRSEGNTQTEEILDQDQRESIQKLKFSNNAICLYDNKFLNFFFIEIISKFPPESNNYMFDDIHLFKTHLKGQNFESAFKILKGVEVLSTWIQCFIMILNKLCNFPMNIITIKRSSFASTLTNIISKNFDDENKNSAILNIKILCLTNLFFRCLSIKQYEYAYLIAEKLNLQYMYKIINSHCKLNKCLGVAYLACNKLEEKQENEDSIISDLNKIITLTNFTLSQNNLQIILKDLDHVLENTSLNNEYIKENNNLEINLQKYLEGLKCEMEGKFDEAKQIYKDNNINHDLLRIEKIQKEIKNQTKEDSIFEFNDF